MEILGDRTQAKTPDSVAFENRRKFLSLVVRGGSGLLLSALVNPGNKAEATQEIVVENCNSIKFDRSEFADPLIIKNPYYPLQPGTQFVMEGTSNRGDGIRHHREVTTVTDLVKEIDGILTVVVLVEDINNEIKTEREIFFAAQDNSGNVWKFGQVPLRYEDEGLTFIGAPQLWIHGQDDAKAGVLVPVKLITGPIFVQGFAPKVDFLNCGEVVSVSVDGKKLIIHERSPLEPDSNAIQVKEYERDSGNTKKSAIDDPEAATLIQESVSKLTPIEMFKVQGEARDIEEHARRLSLAYRSTKPIESRTPQKPETPRQVSVTPPNTGDAGLAIFGN